MNCLSRLPLVFCYLSSMAMFYNTKLAKGREGNKEQKILQKPQTSTDLYTMSVVLLKYILLFISPDLVFK